MWQNKSLLFNYVEPPAEFQIFPRKKGLETPRVFSTEGTRLEYIVLVIFLGRQYVKWGGTMMEENNDKEILSDEQKPEQAESPSEKLEMNPPTGSLVPGAENPESQEIKEERSPNTE